MQQNITISHPTIPPFNMIHVEGGTFLMGDDQSERSNEKPAHEVKVSSFYLAEYLVTQSLWQAIMGNNPSGFHGDNRPVDNVSWLDTQDLIKKLNSASPNPLQGRGLSAFRLPTEAEWQYAASGGIYSQGYTYAGSDKLKQVGWYNENSNGESQDVGLLLANELGLYDMSGNVWEWCKDWFDPIFYEKCHIKGLAENPVNTIKGGYRSLRGGCYFDFAESCRPAYRSGDSPDRRSDFIGLRLCLSLQSVGQPLAFFETKNTMI
jgi:formylglycine-generating enzyme required for sulfatase activity